MTLLTQLLFFCFVHASLLIPGYVIASRLKIFAKNPGAVLIIAYSASLVFFGLLATLRYVLGIDLAYLQLIGWTVLLVSVFFFFRLKLYQNVWKVRFPIICVILMSALSCAFISLSYTAPYSNVPDPEPLADRNYKVLHVKVLNVANTKANDNYIPYRQAQFFVNRSDPAKDSFIDEWGVHFFQRTPLMGAVTAGYFTVLGDRLPIGYTWNSDSQSYPDTYSKFQILAHILNALFLIPAFFLLLALFNKKTAFVSVLFLVSSQFFLYNAFFSWPKSLVAFFVLSMWLLLMEKRLMYTALAGMIAGLAYLTHDLAVMYIGASFVLLLFQKRFRDLIIFAAFSALFAIPWLFISTVLYKKPSTFALYPFSLRGLPQPDQKRQILEEFFRTSPLEIISIRIDTLFYLLSPYDLIYSGGGQSFMRRLWAVGLFSIPGSIGFGLLVPVVAGIRKLWKRIDLWILIFVPILLVASIVGWRGSRAIASLHFAQASVVLLTGVSVSFLVGLKSKLWLVAALFVNTIQLITLILFSYAFKEEAWLNLADLTYLVVIGAIVGVSGWYAFRISNGKLAPKTKKLLGY